MTSADEMSDHSFDAVAVTEVEYSLAERSVAAPYAAQNSCIRLS
jgi:hypothetical protein